MQNSFLFDLIPSGPAMLFLELSQEQTKNARPSQSGLTMFLICFGVVGVEHMNKLGRGKLALLQMMGNGRYVWTGIEIVCRDI